MTALTIILPYQRSSPLYVPTRDLVVSSADSVELKVTVVESDDPSAQALVVTGGIGGPAARLTVWRHGGGGWWDYGRGFSECMETLWSGVGVIDPDVLGTFDITIPAAAMAWWPPRCGWSFQLDWDGGIGSEMIAQGSLHVRRVAGKLFPPVPLLTDGLVPILTD